MSGLLLLVLIGFLAVGLAIGTIYFAAMWWSAQLFAAGEGVAPAVALVAGRFTLMVAVLALVAIRSGALPLLATALGIVISRWVVMRRVKVSAP